MDQNDPILQNNQPLQEPMKLASKAKGITRRSVLIGTVGVIGGSLCTCGICTCGILTSSFLNSWFTTRPSESSGKAIFRYSINTDFSLINVAWSPDGKYVASAGNPIVVWDVFRGTQVFNVHNTRNTMAYSHRNVTWSPDGNYIATVIPSIEGESDAVQIWKMPHGEPVFTYRSSLNWINSVAWSPDGKYIASSGEKVELWNAFTGKLQYIHPEEAATVAWSPDGKRLASICADSRTAESWDALDGRNSITYAPNDYEGDHVLAWSPDSQKIAFYDASGIEIWKASNGQHLSSYQVHGGALMDYYPLIYDMAWSPDGRRLASAADDQTVEICDAMTGNNIFSYTGHADRVVAVSWSPDGKYLASASEDNTLQIWSPD